MSEESADIIPTPMCKCPEYIVHYYEADQGPLHSLSNLSLEEAETVLRRIRAAGGVFASQRNAEYLGNRRAIEERIRQLFIAHGGRPKTLHPHYFILGNCEWVKGWYRNGCAVQVPLSSIDPQVISFTYGDSFPAMRYQDGKPYRGQVYLLADLPDLLARYGLPQVWNSDGAYGPERYIEAQLWEEASALARLGG